MVSVVINCFNGKNDSKIDYLCCFFCKFRAVFQKREILRAWDCCDQIAIFVCNEKDVFIVRFIFVFDYFELIDFFLIFTSVGF